jgi:hypothetical protein
MDWVVFIIRVAYTVELTQDQVLLILIDTRPNPTCNTSTSETLGKDSFFFFGHFDAFNNGALLRITTVPAGIQHL